MWWLSIPWIVYSQYIVNTIGHGHYTNPNTTMTVYDSMFAILPDLSDVYELGIASNIGLLAWICFSMYVLKVKPIVYGILVVLLLRSICIIATILPHTVSEPSDPTIKNMILNTGGEFDKLYSGHMAIFLVISVLLYRHGFNPILLMAANVLYALLILVMRAHYTNDILMAVFAVFALTGNGII